MRIGKRKLIVASAALLGMACTFGPAGLASAKEGTDSSSECIKCHTDLEKMDAFGAAAASSAAGIAG